MAAEVQYAKREAVIVRIFSIWYITVKKKLEISYIVTHFDRMKNYREVTNNKMQQHWPFFIFLHHKFPSLTQGRDLKRTARKKEKKLPRRRSNWSLHPKEVDKHSGVDPIKGYIRSCLHG